MFLPSRLGRVFPRLPKLLLQRPTVSSVIVGARNEEQLRQNLRAADWKLTSEQVAALDTASATTPVSPYWFQRQFAEPIPLPVGDALAAEANETWLHPGAHGNSVSGSHRSSITKVHGTQDFPPCAKKERRVFGCNFLIWRPRRDLNPRLRRERARIYWITL